jgi:hypothetical protein
VQSCLLPVSGNQVSVKTLRRQLQSETVLLWSRGWKKEAEVVRKNRGSRYSIELRIALPLLAYKGGVLSWGLVASSCRLVA